jgi:diaminopimelate decarboxylase/aspartate kinase
VPKALARPYSNRSVLYSDLTSVIDFLQSGDVLGHERDFPESQEGDIILIANTGAYGKVMSSNYNLRDPGKEYCL